MVSASEPITWGKVLKEGGTAAVALMALVLVIWMKVDAGARPDAYTDQDGKAMELRSKERHDHMLHLLEVHDGKPAHTGAATALAAIQADLAHIRSDLLRIEKKLGER